MRFLADENVSNFVIEKLRAAGHEVSSISASHAGVPDHDVLEIARREHSILITEDRDFGELVVRQRHEVAGVILLELDRLSNTAEANLVARVVSTYSGKLSGHLIVIEPARVRIRPIK